MKTTSGCDQIYRNNDVGYYIRSKRIYFTLHVLPIMGTVRMGQSFKFKTLLYMHVNY